MDYEGKKKCVVEKQKLLKRKKTPGQLIVRVEKEWNKNPPPMFGDRIFDNRLTKKHMIT